MSGLSATKLVRITALQSAAALSSLSPPAVLQELAQRFRVNWVVVPEIMSTRTERHQLGSCLRCKGCINPRAAWREIASDAGEWVRHCASLQIGFSLAAMSVLPATFRSLPHL